MVKVQIEGSLSRRRVSQKCRVRLAAPFRLDKMQEISFSILDTLKDKFHH
jgi:hypothetical protein